MIKNSQWWLGIFCGLVAGPALAVGAKSPDFTFGVVADIQYADADANRKLEWHYRQSLTKLEQCVRDFNSDNVTFVVQLGDLVDRDFADYDKVLPIYRQLKMPAYHVIGNHDAIPAAHADGQRLIRKWGIPSNYYDFSYHSWRFIVLDTSGTRVEKTKSPLPTPDTRPAFPSRAKRPSLDADQKAWLKACLDKAGRAKERVIVFGHHPLFPPNAGSNLLNDEEIVRVLEASKCVVAYVCGHIHTGNYAERNGIHYLTLHAMVNTPDQTAYAVIEVYPDHLGVVAKGREPSRTLKSSPFRKNVPVLPGRPGVVTVFDP